MRVTIVMGFFLPVPALHGGATEKSWARLAEVLASRGHEVTVISRAWPGWPREETQRGVRQVRIPGWNHTRRRVVNLWLDWRWGRRVQPALPESDVVICNTVTLPIRLAATRPNAGRVVVMLGRMPKGQVRAYGQVDLLLAPSEAVAARARKENARLAERIVPFPYPIDWTLLQSARRAREPGAPLEVGYVGRLHPEKGIELLLAATRLLRSEPDLPPWRLSLTGPTAVDQGGGGTAYVASLERSFADLFNGPVRRQPPCYDPRELASVYGGVDVFCYPSLADHGESMGVAPLEAMAAGAVPVVSQLACFRDLITPGENGWAFDHTSPRADQALGHLLARLLREPDLRRRCAARAQEDARAFDDAAAITRLEAAFARLTPLPPAR